MTRRDTALLVLIVLLAGLAVLVDLDLDHPAWFENLQFWRPRGARDIATRYGLDLQGGLKVLLAADLAAGQELEPGAMQTARQIVENRVNALGLTEPLVQAQGERRIIVELPGIEDPELAVETIRGTALLEFVDAGTRPLPQGAVIHTSLGGPSVGEATDVLTRTAGTDQGTEPTPSALAPAGPFTSTVPVTSTEPVTDVPTGGQGDVHIYETVLTGAALEQVGLSRSETNQYQIPFRLYADGAEIFAEYTTSHVGQFLCIVLDKRVISCPRVDSAIPSGEGVITLGQATFQEAQNLAVQLQYGALPVPLRIETISTVGPTLGQMSVERSLRAGVIGLSVVLMFMLVYYRLPGVLADVALLIYAALNLAIYRSLPVTLTLPGIAGFLLSAGMAVDANILVFERMKEELRKGRSLQAAIEAGFARAWTSIRDSQFSTLIVCLVLYIFGTNFGASMVRGFALTLAIGTVTNLFTAVVASRTFLRTTFRLAGEWLGNRRWLLGV
jgi:protein-export membrane protein SecD